VTQETNPKPMLQDPACTDDMRSLLTFAREQGPGQGDLDRLAKRLSPLVGVSVGDLSVPSHDLGLGTAPANPPGFASPIGAVGKTTLAKLGMSTLAKTIVAAGIVSAGAVWWALPSANVPAPTRTVAAPSVAPAAPVEAQDEPVAPAHEALVEPIAEPIEAAEPRVKRARVAAPKPVEVPVAIPSEIELIRKAEELRAQPAQSLRALNEHARLYPTGMLAQEREVLAIEALLASGQRPVAEARAKALAAAHPGSAHLRRVRVLLGAGSAD